jgi:hypothetical protein
MCIQILTFCLSPINRNPSMFLSRISLALLATSATISPFASAQGLRKSISSSEEVHIPTHNSFLSSLFGKNNNKNDRELSSTIHYNQMGIDIEGDLKNDNSGKSITMSKDGLRVAVASPGASSGKGITQLFNWDATLEEWVQVGQDIVGPGANFELGWSMDMNDDGSRIVLGAPEARGDDGAMYVYELDGNSTWHVLGSAITPSSRSKGQAGVSVTINASGDRVAFGAPRTNNYVGRVSAFQLVNGQWEPLGQNIDPTDYYAPYSGSSIAMDADGSRLVIGGRLGSYYKGHVTIYDYDDANSQWVLNGQIDGQDYYDRFGGDVDISEDGNRIVVGAFTSDGASGSFEDAGQVCVFEYDGSNWNMIGQQINGAAVKDRMGESVVISGDGTHIAISSPENDENGNNAGKIEVFKYSDASQSWESQGTDIFGECAGDKFGEGGGAIAMDRTGAHLAIGAQRGSYYAGMTRVYESLAGAGDGTNGSTNICD